MANSPALRRLGVILGLLIVAAATHRAAWSQAFAGTDYSGAELFMRYCAACHGETGVGDGPVAASFVKIVPDLTRLSERSGGEFPAGYIGEIIDGRSPVLAHGTRRMPVWGLEFWFEEGGDITAEERARTMISSLIDYIETIQTD